MVAQLSWERQRSSSSFCYDFTFKCNMSPACVVLLWWVNSHLWPPQLIPYWWLNLSIRGWVGMPIVRIPRSQEKVEIVTQFCWWFGFGWQWVPQKFDSYVIFPTYITYHINIYIYIAPVKLGSQTRETWPPMPRTVDQWNRKSRTAQRQRCHAPTKTNTGGYNAGRRCTGSCTRCLCSGRVAGSRTASLTAAPQFLTIEQRTLPVPSRHISALLHILHTVFAVLQSCCFGDRRKGLHGVAHLIAVIALGLSEECSHDIMTLLQYTYVYIYIMS